MQCMVSFHRFHLGIELLIWMLKHILNSLNSMKCFYNDNISAYGRLTVVKKCSVSQCTPSDQNSWVRNIIPSRNEGTLFQRCSGDNTALTNKVSQSQISLCTTNTEVISKIFVQFSLQADECEEKSDEDSYICTSCCRWELAPPHFIFWRWEIFLKYIYF